MKITLFLLTACLTVSVATQARAEVKFTRLFLDNQCYETVEVDYKGKPYHSVSGRDRSLLWLSQSGLPTMTLRKNGTPPWKLSPSEIRKLSRHETWQTKTGPVVESWYVTTCPAEKPLAAEDDNLARPARAGEPVVIHRFHFPNQAEEPYGVTLNYIRVFRGKTDKDGWATLLFAPGVTGRVVFFFNKGNKYPDLGPGTVRPAKAGEQVIDVFHPVTPKGAWR